MPVSLNQENLQKFADNGISQDMIQSTVNGYRNKGLTDDEIQQIIDNKILQFDEKKLTPKQTNGIDLTPSGLLKRAIAGAISAPLRMRMYGEDYKTAYDTARNIQETNPWSKGASVVTDIGAYAALPQATALKGAGLGAKALNMGLTGAYQGGLASGLESLKQNGDLSGIGSGAGIGGAIGAGLPVGGKLVSLGLNSPVFKNSFSGINSLLSSVPYEYIQRALNKELNGNSILKGKFNTQDLNQNYLSAGKKAIKGLKELEISANQNLNEKTRKLNELPQINREQLTNKLIGQIDEYANGGARNSAIDEKGKDIYKYLEQVANDTDNVSLDATKDQIQNLVASKYGAETGNGINALKGMAHTIKEELENLSPEYAQANAKRAKLHEIKNTLNGLNEKTIATKLRNADTDASVRNAYNQAAQELDSLVSTENKFLEDVRDLRAREALEQWYPGQYGGMGSQSGVANLIRGTAAASGIGGSLLAHNPVLALATLVSMSPKLGAKNAIRNVGRLNNFALNENKINKTAQRILPANSARMPILYGYVNYDENR